MKLSIKVFVVVTAIAVVLVACTAQKEAPKVAESKAPADTLVVKIRRFAPTDLSADTSHLSENDRKALDKLIEAAKLLDPLFLRQVWSGNEALLKRLESDSSPEGRERLHY